MTKTLFPILYTSWYILSSKIILDKLSRINIEILILCILCINILLFWDICIPTEIDVQKQGIWVFAPRPKFSMRLTGNCMTYKTEWLNVENLFDSSSRSYKLKLTRSQIISSACYVYDGVWKISILFFTTPSEIYEEFKNIINRSF